MNSILFEILKSKYLLMKIGKNGWRLKTFVSHHYQLSLIPR